MIFDFSTEGSHALCDRWNDRELLTLSEFHTALREVSIEAAQREGTCNKIRGTFAYVDANGDEQEYVFRIDASAHTLHKTLADHFDGWVSFYSTERGEVYARQYGKRPAAEAVAHFEALAQIARAAA